MVEVPKGRIPDQEMLPETAYQIVLDEVMLDGNGRFNLATFVTTWMDEEADRLYAATTMVDKDEYPQTAEIEARCVLKRGLRRHGPLGGDVSLSPHVSKYDVSRKLRERGWLVPAYTMPPKRDDLAVLRSVVRNGFSHDMAELFLRDMRAAVDYLTTSRLPMPREEQPSSFHH